MHSNSHLGISMMAMAHLGVTVPEISYEIDTHYPWQSDEVIQGGRIRFEDGCIDVPAKPGLGVELDRPALERLHQNYPECGIRDRNDEAEMQKVNPGWTFKTHIF
jgi:glucarate dehydratase